MLVTGDRQNVSLMLHSLITIFTCRIINYFVSMPLNRSEDRNVHFFDESKPDIVLGGLVQNGSVTVENFISMLAIVLVRKAPIYVYAKVTGNAVSMSDEPLQVGDYVIRCEGKCIMLWYGVYLTSGRNPS